jgi:hypothetical protein
MLIIDNVIEVLRMLSFYRGTVRREGSRDRQERLCYAVEVRRITSS